LVIAECAGRHVREIEIITFYAGSSPHAGKENRADLAGIA
jgi:hypothetical protein